MIAYAPILDSQIPAFKTKIQNDNHYPSTVRINFTHNLAVAYSDVAGIVLKIKSLVPQKGELKNTFLCQAWESVTQDILKKGELSFNDFRSIDGNIKFITPGNYYKIQIAYFSAWLDDNKSKGPDPDSIGTYSTVGIARCLSEDTTIEIKGLDPAKEMNPDEQTYQGIYRTGTTTEIVYRYKFDLKTNNEQLLESSGWQFPAGEEMKFSHRQWLTENEKYKLTFTVTTVNGYEESVTYTVARVGTYPSPTVDLVLVASQDTPEAKEGGYVDIYFAPVIDANGNVTTQLTTSYGVLLRQKEGEPITRWEELAKFKLVQNSYLENYAWKDFSVEHGESYIYAIRFYSVSDGRTEWTDMIKSTDPLPNVAPSTDNERPSVTVQFENMYLGDGDKQLCIRLNPKVSSFKDTILEQKMDTIGGKYPYFFRNGDVKYKEIPISGLISYWMDEYGYFLGIDAAIQADKNKQSQQKKDQVSKDAISILKNAQADLGFDSNQKRTRTIKRNSASLAPWYNTNLTNNNFAAERKFKLEVMDWLTNGKPKLFRSAAEGNYVVRLMNTSLTPNDQLGRMLHNFTSTGYEVMDADIVEMKLAKNNVVSFPQWINYEDAVDQERTYVWNQSISNRSIKVNVNRPATYSRMRAILPEKEYALVEQQENTIKYEFQLNENIIPTEVKILLPYKNEYYEDSFVDDSQTIMPYVMLSDIMDAEGKIPVGLLPEQFAVAIDQCSLIIQHQMVNKQGYDIFHNLVVTSHRYLFSIEENETCSTRESDLLYDQKIKRLYNLTVTPAIGVAKQDAWVEIQYEDMTTERLDLSDGLQRVYRNIDNIRKIEKGQGVRLDIYALIQPNASSALDAFILDVSVLGGSL